MDSQECIQATSTLAIIDSVNVTAGGADQSNVIIIKGQPDRDDDGNTTGPTLLNHYFGSNEVPQSEFTVIEMEVDLVHVKGEMTPPGDAPTATTEAGVSKTVENVEGGTIHSSTTCSYCLKTFSRKKLLKTHMKHVHGECSYECPECEKSFHCQQYLLKHVRRMHRHSVDHECKFCKKIFRSKQSMTRHISYTHLNNTAGSQPRVYICHYCQSTFTVRPDIIKHITSLHERRSHKCSQCKKCFKFKQYLLKHTARCLHGPRQACKVCGKIFKVVYLKRHMLEVHGGQLMPCEFCGKTMKSKRCLRQHVQSFHCEQLTHKCGTS